MVSLKGLQPTEEWGKRKRDFDKLEAIELRVKIRTGLKKPNRIQNENAFSIVELFDDFEQSVSV